MNVTEHVTEKSAPGLQGHPAISSRGTFIGAVAIFTLTLACHLPLLGNPPLAGTEGHRVFPALHMVRSGDWILPRLYGQLYLIKPPLHDWLIAIAQLIAGKHGNVFVWRFPSVLGAAALNVVLYLFGCRWFGRVGGIVSGLCGLGLLALWGQARTADVDSTNTLACTVAVLCLIELHFGQPRRRWPWIWGAGFAIGATLLTKGPAGLPILIGEWLWVFFKPGWDAGLHRPIGQDVRAGLRALAPIDRWAPLLIGIGLFAAYSTVAAIMLYRLHLPSDYSGFREVGEKLFPDSFARLAEAALVPVQVFAFTLPVSLALPLSMVRGFREAIRASEVENHFPRARVCEALAGTVLLSWCVCILTGMVNPRYAYVTVAPLCLLAGAIAASVPFQSPSAASVLRAVSLGCVVVLLGGNWFFAAITLHKDRLGLPVIVMAAILAAVIAVITWMRLSKGPSWAASWGLPMLLVLAAVPFAYQFRLERLDRSGAQASRWLRNTVGTGETPILTGAVLHSQPELFWYAGLFPQVTPTFALQAPSRYPGGRWVIMDRDEYGRWIQVARKYMSRRRIFTSHKYMGIVVWYSGMPTTQPAEKSAR